MFCHHDKSLYRANCQLVVCVAVLACSAARADLFVDSHELSPFRREGTERWLDIHDQPYSLAFQQKFSYAACSVRVDYFITADGRLRGHLQGRELKPNFVYQLKLEGLTNEPAGSLEAWTNEQLGRLGRRWCTTCRTNVEPKDAPKHEGHPVLGYLLFDFFVTDNLGVAAHDFIVDSSFRVVWKTSQRRRSANDGPLFQTYVWGTPQYGYARYTAMQPVGLYAQREANRSAPGELRLPPGRYRCRLLLTEESFHAGYPQGTDDPRGGSWAHCLSDENLEFVIPVKPGTETPPTP